MSRLIKRVLKSPRLSTVLIALAMPMSLSVYFAPAWAQAASVIMLVPATLFMYAKALSPKFIHRSSKSMRSAKAELAIEESIDSISAYEAPVNDAKNPPKEDLEQANFEIETALQQLQHASYQVGTAVQEIGQIQETQNALTKELLARQSESGPQAPSITDLAAQAALLLRSASLRSDTIAIQSAHRLADHLEERLAQVARSIDALDELQLEAQSHFHSAIVGQQFHDISTQGIAAARNVLLNNQSISKNAKKEATDLKAENRLELFAD